MTKMSKEQRYEYIYLCNAMGKYPNDIAEELGVTPSFVKRTLKVILAFEVDDYETVVNVGRTSGINRLIAWCEMRFNKEMPEEYCCEYQQIAEEKNSHLPYANSKDNDEEVDDILTQINNNLIAIINILT